MSETVHYRGHLTRVNNEGESVEECAKRLYPGDLDIYDDYTEKMDDKGCHQHVVHSGIVYEVDKESIDLDGDIIEASRAGDGKIWFEVRYYNGGCSFDEAIQEALDKITE